MASHTELVAIDQLMLRLILSLKCSMQHLFELGLINFNTFLCFLGRRGHEGGGR